MADYKPDKIIIKAVIYADSALEMVESSLELKIREKELLVSGAERIVMRGGNYIISRDVNGYKDDVAEIGKNGVPYRTITYKLVE